MMCPSGGVDPTGFLFRGLTKVFKTDLMSINPPDLHNGQQGRQGRGFVDKESGSERLSDLSPGIHSQHGKPGVQRILLRPGFFPLYQVAIQERVTR